MRFCRVKILGEMRTAAAAVFRCLAQLGGNSVQTGVVWGAVRRGGGGVRLDTDAAKRKKEKRKENRSLFDVVP